MRAALVLTVVVAGGLALAACGDLAGSGAAGPEGEGSGASDPHTEEEREELLARGEASEHAGEVQEWARSEAAEHFGGLWIDQAAGGALTLAFTEDADAYRAEIEERFGVEVVTVEVERTLAELERLAEEASAQMGEQHQADEAPGQGTITAVAVDVQANRVALDLLGGDEERRAELSEQFGADAICLRVEPIPGDEEAEVASWAPDPGEDFGPDSTEIRVLLRERACASGEPADGRVAEPEVEYRDDSVVVVLRVIPRPGPQTCPGNPETPYTIELDEPLGDRDLLDGASDPPSQPHLED